MQNASALPHRNALRPALLWAAVCLILLGVLLSLLPRLAAEQQRARHAAETDARRDPSRSQRRIYAAPRPPAHLAGQPRQTAGPARGAAVVNPAATQPGAECRKRSAGCRRATGLGEISSGSTAMASVDPATRARLQNGGEAQAQWILSQLYSAFSGVSGKELQNDPLMLMRGAQLALAKNSQKMQLMDGWLVTKDAAGNYWYLLHGELAGSSFDMQQTHQLVTTLNALQQTLKSQYPQAQLLSRGTVFYSDYASQQAKNDISTLGVATVLGVILLIVSVFRSVRPLLLSLLSIAIGALAGTVVTLLLFGELHLMTLVMSMSIIGISADYTIYYLTERMVHGAEHSPSAKPRQKCVTRCCWRC